MKLLLCLLPLSSAFLGKPIVTPFRPSRHVVYIDAETAKLIDDQLWRQTHTKEVEAAWQKKNAAVLEHKLPNSFDFDDHMMEDNISPRQLVKDRRLASKDPVAYCADRCVATGNCDVFEDVFKLSAKEVMEFCNDCVLSDGEEPCDVPVSLLEEDEGFYRLRP